MLIHERQEQSRIDPSAQQNSHRDITQQMPLDCVFVEIKELCDNFFVLLWRSERRRNKIVPPLFPAFALFTDEHRTGRKFPDSLENSKRRWGVSKPEKQVKRNRVHGWLSAVCSEDRTNFRSEGQP